MSPQPNPAQRDVYEEAKEMYCTMRVCRTADIAKRVQQSSEQIVQWKKQGNWFELRARRQAERKQEISAHIGTRFDNALQIGKSALVIREMIQQELEYYKSVQPGKRHISEISALTENLKRVDLILERQQDAAEKGRFNVAEMFADNDGTAE